MTTISSFTIFYKTANILQFLTDPSPCIKIFRSLIYLSNPPSTNLVTLLRFLQSYKPLPKSSQCHYKSIDKTGVSLKRFYHRCGEWTIATKEILYVLLLPKLPLRDVWISFRGFSLLTSTTTCLMMMVFKDNFILLLFIIYTLDNRWNWSAS